MRRLSRLALMFSCLVAMHVLTLAQTNTPTQITPNTATGIQPYNSYAGVRENINLATGNLNLQIPLVSLPGRDGHDLDFFLTYDSKIWDLTGDASSGNYGFDSSPYAGFGFGWGVAQLQSTNRFVNSTLACNADFTLIMADGTLHSFGIGTAGPLTQCVYHSKSGQTTPCPSCSVNQGDTDDGSYIHLDISNINDNIAYLKSGERLHFNMSASGGQGSSVNSIEDTNGNFITYTYSQNVTTIQDTLKRSITIGPASVSYVDSNGTTQTVSFGYSTINLAPTFSLPTGAIPPPNQNRSMMTTVTLPNQRTYNLEYNNFGELTKITYPTGGYTRYDYEAFTAYYPKPVFLAGDFREVTAKHVCYDPAGACTQATEVTTTYTPTIDNQKTSNQYMDVQEPLGKLTHYQFSYAIRTSPGSPLYSPRELSRTISDNGTALRTITRTYDNLDGTGNTTNASLPLTETTTLLDVSPNLVKETTWTYDTFNGASIDNVMNESEYDYGSGAVGPLFRQRVSTYLHTNPVNGIDYTAGGVHILDRKLTENIEDSTNNPIAQMKYEYDNYSSISASGAVQHDSTFSTSYKIRGNVTTTSRWRNTDNTWLATVKTYDDAGNVLTSTDPKGNLTTLGYTDNWANTTCQPSGGSGAAYVTSAKNALNQITSYQYNSCTGTMASLADPNSQQTTFQYDLLSRLTLMQYPPQGSAHGQTTYCFSDTPGSSCNTAGQIFLTRTDAITSSMNMSRAIWVDGVGHVVKT